MKKERIEWIDIAKLLGMIGVFFIHFGPQIGRLYGFAFVGQVQLFFFISGIFAVNLEQLTFKGAVKKRFEQIIIPYVFFVIITMILIVLTADTGFPALLIYLKQFIWGIRNQTYAAALWFFSCLFCMSVLFEVLRRLLRHKGLLLLATIGLYILSIRVFPNRPDAQPSWIFNIDSACYYLIYYTFGYLSIPLLQKKVNDTKSNKIVSLVGIAVLACYAVLVYMGKDLEVAANTVYRILPFANEIYLVVRTLLIILFNLVLARLLAGFGKLAHAGAQTLWLCGNEFVVKQIFSAAAGILGLEITITSTLAAFIYAIAMVVFVLKVLMPIEMKFYRQYIDCIGLICPALHKEI